MEVSIVINEVKTLLGLMLTCYGLGVILDSIPELKRYFLTRKKRDITYSEIATFNSIISKNIFEKFLGSNFLTLKYIFKSFLLSLVCLVIVAVIRNDLSDIFSNFNRLDEKWIILIFLCFILSNMLTDWLSFAQTQTFVDLSSRVKNIKELLLIAISDLFITITLFSVAFSFFLYIFSSVLLFSYSTEEVQRVSSSLTLKVQKRGAISASEHSNVSILLTVINRDNKLQTESKIIDIKAKALNNIEYFNIEDLYDIHKYFKFHQVSYFSNGRRISEEKLITSFNNSNNFDYTITYFGKLNPITIFDLSFTDIYLSIDKLRSLPFHAFFSNYFTNNLQHNLGLKSGFISGNGEITTNLCIVKSENNTEYKSIDFNFANTYKIGGKLDLIEKYKDLTFCKVFLYGVKGEFITDRHKRAQTLSFYRTPNALWKNTIDLGLFFVSSFALTLVYYLSIISYFIYAKTHTSLQQNKIVSKIFLRNPFGCIGLLAGLLIYITGAIFS